MLLSFGGAELHSAGGASRGAVGGGVSLWKQRWIVAEEVWKRSWLGVGMVGGK